MNGWLTIEGENLVRVFIVGLVLMSVCASLLGVVMGWKLREREVKVLKRRVAVLRLQLGKKRAREIERSDGYEECGDQYVGSDKEDLKEDLSGWRCSRPKGHYPETKHGYAGVFWGEGSR